MNVCESCVLSLPHLMMGGNTWGYGLLEGGPTATVLTVVSDPESASDRSLA